ncbi:MAG: LysR family transcriptional regulator [Eubacterium sp.]|nr:LysR family transcriptional regulator [Eubacterium sp.]
MIDNLNYYKAFYIAADTGSISGAAEALYISQPAVSRAISCLEEALGMKLLIRNSRGVKLTNEGHVLYYHLQDVFDSLKKAEVELNHISEFGIDELRIGVSTSLCRYILMPYLKKFIADNPHIKVTIDCHSTFNILKQLQEDNIDVGFICETGLQPGYVYKPFQEVHDVFVTTESYLKNLNLRENAARNDSGRDSTPLFMAGNMTAMFDIRQRAKADNEADNNESSTDNTSALSPKEILECANLMLLEKNNITRKHLDSYFYDNDINPDHILEINNMDLLIDFASIGMGISGVVREFVLDRLEGGQIVEIPLSKPIPTRTVGFVYKRSLLADSPSAHFMEYCRK